MGPDKDPETYFEREMNRKWPAWILGLGVVPTDWKLVLGRQKVAEGLRKDRWRWMWRRDKSRE
jgi:hypothetical protein